MPTIDILLATLNGAAFLPEQLRSLDFQTFKDWRLLVRDDGSDDKSLDLVRAWAAASARDIVVVEDGDLRIGPEQSFARLLAKSDAPYFAFCDQDDVWHPSKLMRLMSEMQELEVEIGKNAPLLVHCDLSIVDAQLSPSGTSFWQNSAIGVVSVSKFEFDERARKSLLLQNIVTGCATLGNATLRRLALPFPKDLQMHDWWVAMIAAYVGAVKGVEEPLVDYRQHSFNTVGASDWSVAGLRRRAASNPSGGANSARRKLAGLQRQCLHFVDRFSKDMTDDDVRILREFAFLNEKHLFRRKTFMLRQKVYPQSSLRGVVLWLFM